MEKENNFVPSESNETEIILDLINSVLEKLNSIVQYTSHAQVDMTSIKNQISMKENDRAPPEASINTFPPYSNGTEATKNLTSNDAMETLPQPGIFNWTDNISSVIQSPESNDNIAPQESKDRIGTKDNSGLTESPQSKDKITNWADHLLNLITSQTSDKNNETPETKDNNGTVKPLAETNITNWPDYLLALITSQTNGANNISDLTKSPQTNNKINNWPDYLLALITSQTSNKNSVTPETKDNNVTEKPVAESSIANWPDYLLALITSQTSNKDNAPLEPYDTNGTQALSGLINSSESKGNISPVKDSNGKEEMLTESKITDWTNYVSALIPSQMSNENTIPPKPNKNNETEDFSALINSVVEKLQSIAELTALAQQEMEKINTLLRKLMKKEDYNNSVSDKEEPEDKGPEKPLPNFQDSYSDQSGLF